LKVALVNTNRYLHPPVVPVGLEYLVEPLEQAGHPVEVLDLAFAEDPVGELVRFLDAARPDVTGLSVRNVDTGAFVTSLFFLDEVASLVEAAKRSTGKPVVVGGSATLCAGEALREYVGADYLVTGPGEVALPELVRSIQSDPASAPATVDGWSRGIIPGACYPRGRSIDYAPYLEGGHPVGIEFRRGCDWACRFCVERKTPRFTRDREAVLREARSLAEAGVGMAFLCDTEVNQDLDGTHALLSAIADEDLGLEWSGYFKPTPFDPLTARLAARSGFEGVTLWVASVDLSGGDAPYGAREVTRFIELCKAEGTRVAVDLLVGYPGESDESIERAFALLAGARPATVGVTAHIRLYETTPAAADAARAGGRLVGAVEDNPSLLKPVFYSSVDPDWLKEKIGGDKLFVMEGESRTVNYQRI